jgi:hypothetical protein
VVLPLRGDEHISDGNKYSGVVERILGECTGSSFISQSCDDSALSILGQAALLRRAFAAFGNKDEGSNSASTCAIVGKFDDSHFLILCDIAEIQVKNPGGAKVDLCAASKVLQALAQVSHWVSTQTFHTAQGVELHTHVFSVMRRALYRKPAGYPRCDNAWVRAFGKNNPHSFVVGSGGGGGGLLGIAFGRWSMN